MLRFELPDTAILINPADVDDILSAIKTVLSNPVRRDELIKKGFDRAERFTWENTARMTMDVYRNVIDSGS